MRRLSYLFPALAILTSCLDLVAASLWSPDSDSPLWPLQSYKSSSIQTPFMNVTKSGQTEPGLLFLTPADIVRQHAPAAIYSDDGQLVWQGPDDKHFSALQSEILDGEPVLVYWAGTKLSGFGFGHISILNGSYDEIHRVTLDCKEHNIVTVADSKQQFDSCIDTHETRLTEHGTVVTTVANVTNADLSSIGGPRDGWIQDSLVYEIDVKTNEVLFRWSTYEHRAELPLNYSMVPLQEEYYGTGESVKSAYEYSHVNSVVRYGDKYLVSARFMCSIFFVASNGTVIWHLHGPTGGDFNLGLGTSFCHQHDAQFLYQSPERVTMSIHNNENGPNISQTTMTTGMVLDIELQGSKEVTLRRELWDAAHPVYSLAQGNYQTLENGHVLLCHGYTPKIEEYDEKGAVVMSARFGYDNTMGSYRVFRGPWVGRPATKPDVVACKSSSEWGGAVAVYVSWNGATDVQSWKVYSGSQVKKTAVRNGFETRIPVDGLDESDSVVVEAVCGVGDGTRSRAVTVQQEC